MSAKSILPSGHTKVLSQISVGAINLVNNTGNQITLECTTDGTLVITGEVTPVDIVDNNGSVGTPGQYLGKDGSNNLVWMTP